MAINLNTNNPGVAQPKAPSTCPEISCKRVAKVAVLAAFIGYCIAFRDLPTFGIVASMGLSHWCVSLAGVKVLPFIFGISMASLFAPIDFERTSNENEIVPITKIHPDLREEYRELIDQRPQFPVDSLFESALRNRKSNKFIQELINVKELEPTPSMFQGKTLVYSLYFKYMNYGEDSLSLLIRYGYATEPELVTALLNAQPALKNKMPYYIHLLTETTEDYSPTIRRLVDLGAIDKMPVIQRDASSQTDPRYARSVSFEMLEKYIKEKRIFYSHRGFSGIWFAPARLSAYGNYTLWVSKEILEKHPVCNVEYDDTFGIANSIDIHQVVQISCDDDRIEQITALLKTNGLSIPVVPHDRADSENQALPMRNESFNWDHNCASDYRKEAGK